jgi:hypothetical protein
VKRPSWNDSHDARARAIGTARGELPSRPGGPDEHLESRWRAAPTRAAPRHEKGFARKYARRVIELFFWVSGPHDARRALNILLLSHLPRDGRSPLRGAARRRMLQASRSTSRRISRSRSFVLDFASAHSTPSIPFTPSTPSTPFTRSTRSPRAAIGVTRGAPAVAGAGAVPCVSRRSTPMTTIKLPTLLPNAGPTGASGCARAACGSRRPSPVSAVAPASMVSLSLQSSRSLPSLFGSLEGSTSVRGD